MSRAKVTFKTTASSRKAFTRLATSSALGDELEVYGDRVLSAARRDPNEVYVRTLRLTRHVSAGKRSRISIRVGAANFIGGRVEAKRGTLARAVTSAGL